MPTPPRPSTSEHGAEPDAWGRQDARKPEGPSTERCGAGKKPAVGSNPTPAKGSAQGAVGAVWHWAQEARAVGASVTSGSLGRGHEQSAAQRPVLGGAGSARVRAGSLPGPGALHYDYRTAA
jgi:hypothetical protein